MVNHLVTRMNAGPMAETVSAGIAFKGAQRQQKNSHKLLIFMDVSFKFVQSISKEVSR